MSRPSRPTAYRAGRYAVRALPYGTGYAVAVDAAGRTRWALVCAMDPAAPATRPATFRTRYDALAAAAALARDDEPP